MFGITLAAAELTKNFGSVEYGVDEWRPICLGLPTAPPCAKCKRFDKALKNWVKLNHPNYWRYT